MCVRIIVKPLIFRIFFSSFNGARGGYIVLGSPLNACTCITYSRVKQRTNAILLHQKNNYCIIEYVYNNIYLCVSNNYASHRIFQPIWSHVSRNTLLFYRYQNDTSKPHLFDVVRGMNSIFFFYDEYWAFANIDFVNVLSLVCYSRMIWERGKTTYPFFRRYRSISSFVVTPSYLTAKTIGDPSKAFMTISVLLFYLITILTANFPWKRSGEHQLNVRRFDKKITYETDKSPLLYVRIRYDFVHAVENSIKTNSMSDNV